MERGVEFGKALILLGFFLIAVGAALTFGDRIPLLGKLPGDLVYRKGNTTLYFPLATSIVLSILASGVLYLLRK